MAIDMMTYEFLKRYVEGSVMGDNATPRGIWTENPTPPYAKGHYVTHNNAIYIWYNEETSTTKENPKPGTGNGWEECWQEIIKTVGYYDKDRLENHTYYTPSTGLEIVDGVVVGIGSCRDEHIVIPEVDEEGNDVYAVADGVFGYLLGTEGEFIKSITFPPSVKWLGEEDGIGNSIIYSVSCPNLEAVYILNPKIDWAESPVSPFKLLGAVKDVYFGGTRKQWLELNTGHSLIQLSNENIAAGIVPTLHYGYFAASSEVERLEKSFANLEENVGSIDTALDAILAIQESIIGGVEQ